MSIIGEFVKKIKKIFKYKRRLKKVKKAVFSRKRKNLLKSNQTGQKKVTTKRKTRVTVRASSSQKNKKKSAARTKTIKKSSSKAKSKAPLKGKGKTPIKKKSSLLKITLKKKRTKSKLQEGLKKKKVPRIASKKVVYRKVKKISKGSNIKKKVLKKTPQKPVSKKVEKSSTNYKIKKKISGKKKVRKHSLASKPYNRVVTFKKSSNMEDNRNHVLLGVITHYFSKIKVVVVKVNSGKLVVGDYIRIKGKSTDFSQKVVSLQVESVDVKIVKKGQLVGLRVKKKPKEGDLVYILK